MKKITKLSVVLLVGLLVFTGCSDKNDNKLDKDSDKGSSIQENKDTKVLRCTKSEEVTTGIEADFIYEVTYTGTYVDKVHTVEKLMSDNEEYLNLYKELVEKQYEPFKDVKYYDYDITVKDGVLTSTVDINYAKIDTDQMLEINSSLSALIKDGKVKVSDMQSLYETIGAVCK